MVSKWRKLSKLCPRRVRGRESSLANTVREPAVEEGLIGWPALGEAQVAFALERLERAQQHGLAAAPAALGEESVQRRQGSRADPPVRRQIGIVAAVAVERGQRALEKGDGDCRS